MNREEKAQFMAQNIGSCIWDSDDGEGAINQKDWIISKASVDGQIWVRHLRDDQDHLIGTDENPLERFSVIKKPLSTISDEHAIEVAKMCSNYAPLNESATYEVFTNAFGNKVVSWGDSPKAKYLVNHAAETRAGSQYLIGNGYAIKHTTPIGDTISVEEQLKRGWIKLEEQ